MKTSLKTLMVIVTLSLAAAAWSAAGDYYMQPTAAAPPSLLFDEGWTLNPYGLYLTPDADRADDTFGGGVSLDYFFNDIVGLSGSGAWADPGTGEIWHNYTIDLILRAPMESIGLAPYALIGGGVILEDNANILGRAGVGLDLRFSESFGIYTDWIYNFPGGGGGDDDLEDYQMVRFGVKFAF